MPATARLVFVGLFSLADDAGRMPGSAVFIRSKVFPYDDATSSADVEAALMLLHNAQRIRLYGATQRYVEVLNFTKHQRIQKPQPSQLPAPSRSHPVLAIEGAPEQVIPLPVSDQSLTSINGSGGEGNGMEVSELRSSSSAGGLEVVSTTAAPVRKRKPVKPTDPQVVGCFNWYCDLWGKTGAYSLELTTKRARAIEKALKQHGAEKVAAVIRGHHTNPWRHEQLNRNDITVLLRDDNIDAGFELAAKAAGIRSSGPMVDDVERMGY